MRKPEYERLMEQAPQIKASGLEGDYRLLAEFNDVVLAGHQTKYGMEFVTWEWVQGHTSLWQGHYYGDNYEGARLDFVTRAGLIPQDRLLSSEQLVEVYRSVHDTLDSEYPLTREREQLLKGVAAQIERTVPNLDELVQKSNEAELLAQEQTDTPGMTQQF